MADSVGSLEDSLVLNREIRARHGLFRNLAYMVTSSGVTRSGSFLFSILSRRILDPQLIGIWNLIGILTTYLSSVTIGVSYSSERLIPYYRARGDQDTVSRIRDFLFTSSILEGVLVSLGVVVYALLFGERYEESVRLGLYWLPFLYFPHKLLSLCLMLLRSSKEFRFYSVANIVSTWMDWSLLGWAFLGGLQGVFAG